MKATEVHDKLSKRKDHSAWDKGVTRYAHDMLDTLEQSDVIDPENIAFESWTEAEKIMLNGATSWNQYSYGGCSLICDCDIAELLCTPSELKRKRSGELPPNSREEWLDVQARALYQAARRVFLASKGRG